MSGAEEFASTSVKRFDWSGLPPGEYKVSDNGDVIPVDVKKDDPVAAALKAFALSLEGSDG